MTISFAAYTPLIDYDAELGTGVPGQWDDQSGNGWHATQSTASKRMTLVAGSQMVNGLPAFQAQGKPAGAGTRWEIPDAAFTGMTAAEALLVFMRSGDWPASTDIDGGLWNFGNGNANFQPYLNGYFYENFFSDARKDTIISPHNYPLLSGKPHVYNVWSAPSDWGVYVDLGQRSVGSYSTISNTFTLPPAGNACLGTSGTSTDGGVGYFGFMGYIWRFLLFDRKLSTGDRTAITNSLFSYYGGGSQATDLGKSRNSYQPDRSLMVQDAGLPLISREDYIKCTRTNGSGYPIHDSRPDKIYYTRDNRSNLSQVTLSYTKSRYYEMIAKDSITGLWLNPWIVQNAPDTTGALYPGPGSVNVSSIRILNEW